MIPTSPHARISRLAKGPLFVALVIALGSAASIPAMAATGREPALAPRNNGVRLGDQGAILAQQLLRRPAMRGAATARAAAVVSVANCDDSGTGSLRDAVVNAVSGDTIDLSALGCSTITLTSGALDASVDDLTLQGPGAALLAIDGNGSDRVISHLGYGTLTLDGVTVRNGSYTYTGPVLYAGLAAGGCVLSKKNVTITDAVIDHCSASGYSVFGGAVDALGVLTLVDSTISGTTSTATAASISATIYGGVAYGMAAYLTHSTISDASIMATTTSAFGGTLGGGVFGFYGVVLTDSLVSGVDVHVTAAKDAYAKGGGIASPRTVVMSGSTVSGNTVEGTPGVGASGDYVYTSAIGGAGVYIASIPRSAPVVSSITNSTISGNRALCDGDIGAYTVGGGGALASWSPLPVGVVNSTISGNVASTFGGGLYTRHQGAIALSNSTITGNTAPNGGGIADHGEASVYSLASDSSIVAGNHMLDTTDPVEIDSLHAIAGAHNLIDSANVALPADTLGGDPLLAPLADNGGQTQTHALLAGSTAIDAGSNAAALNTDQRGDGFVRVYGAATDIGAYERQAPSDLIFADGFD